MQVVAKKNIGIDWVRHCYLVIAGAFAPLAFAPLYFLPALLLSLAYLIVCVQNAPSWRSAFGQGYAYSFGTFVTGTYWVCFSFMVEFERFGWLIPFVIMILPGFMAIYGAIASAFSFFARKRIYLYWAVFAVAWVVLEGLRSWIPFAFPWNLVGYSLMMTDATAQAAAYVGVYGLSFMAVLMAGSIALLTQKKFAPFILCLSVFMVVWLGGRYRLQTHPTTFTSSYMRIVQPNIDQKIKWDRAHYASNFRRYLTLTQLPSEHPLSLIVWPEMATPFDLQTDAVARKLIHSAMSDHSAYLLLGSSRYGRDAQGGIQQFWNSLYVLNAQGEVSEIYDKRTLVPFGEYMPGRGWLPIEKIEAFAMGSHGGDFSRGKGVATLRVDSLPDVSPLICFEGVFSGRVARYEKDQRPAWLLNVTNDAWFGNTSGPRQHADMVRLRAIEEGLPMVRAAGTGISYVSDAYGRIITIIPLNTEGVQDLYLPRPAEKETFYRKLAGTIMGFLK